MPALLRYRSLVALAEAWPYRAPSALCADLAVLRRDELLAAQGRPTHALAEDFEAEARLLARGHSLATLEAIRDRAWFPESLGPAHRPLPLHEHLLELAQRYLHSTGDAVRLRGDAADGPGIGLRWRQLSLLLPQDLLVAALAAAAGVDDLGHDRVRLVEPGLARVLDRPVAETHLHVGAAIEFGELWLALLDQLRSPSFDASVFRKPPAPFSDSRAYARALVHAALLRHLLMSFGWHRTVRGHGGPEDFRAFVHGELPDVARRAGAGLRAQLVHEACLDALAGLAPLQSHRRRTNLAGLRRAHALLWGSSRRGRSSAGLSLIHADPLSCWLKPKRGCARPETRLLTWALRYCSAEGAGDRLFARALWQYVRVRNICFGHLVQRPGTSGLGWFTRHYDRLRAHRGVLATRTVESALRLQSSELNLASLEVRTAPASRWVEIRDEVRGVARQAAAYTPAVGVGRPEIALVLHFLKAPSVHVGGFHRLHAEPGGRINRHRYGRWFRDAWTRAGAIVEALEADPKLLLILRGLDVAAHELSIPVWPLVPVFERVHAGARRAAQRLGRDRPDWEVHTLQTTLHLGEEFRRPVEGLRRIDEALRARLLGNGSRIGHGLVLGWPMDAWCDCNPLVAQPREDRLHDLLWELDLYRRNQVAAAAATRPTAVAAECEALARNIYGEAVPISVLLEARALLFDPRRLLTGLGYPRGRGPGCEPPRSAAARLATRYLEDRGVYQRAVALIEVAVEGAERSFLSTARAWLVEQLAGLDVTIEANPSSNLVIGDFDHLGDHPTFRLAPVERGRAAELPVSINSDDPLTFASKLADEYAYLDFANRSRRIDASASLAWLERAREAGWGSRFSLPASREPGCLEQLLGRRPRP